MVKHSLSDMVLDNVPRDYVKRRKPKWLKAELPKGQEYRDLHKLIRDNKLHTVCESARCPNMGECWSAGVATIMILGDVCTRSCGFCHIKTGKPPVLDTEEPARVAEAIRIMDLNFLVITSVNRDELPDGGAEIWAETIRQTREASPKTKIEVLIPDFCGDWDALQTVLDAKPDVINHNLETVGRMYRAVRPQAKYLRSLELLRRCKEQGFIAKTGIMVGIGETDEEVHELMDDLLEKTNTDHGPTDILTIGQYLQPSRFHLPVSRFVTPEQFNAFKEVGEAKGITHVESGPMVRSSYHADQQAKNAKAQMEVNAKK